MRPARSRRPADAGGLRRALGTIREAVDVLRVAAKERPDAILLDVMMPEMDGPATARALKGAAETAEIPIILLTAKVQAADRRRFDDLGVAGVLSKPFDPMELAAQVSGVLGWAE